MTHYCENKDGSQILTATKKDTMFWHLFLTANAWNLSGLVGEWRYGRIMPAFHHEKGTSGVGDSERMWILWDMFRMEQALQEVVQDLSAATKITVLENVRVTVWINLTST